ncbi:MAG: hypothetical protein EYC70_14770 [Planctomycetota bacterium]|nr:MAG: hypothetical protein EYC70_14770 [Planctomycetota bacterium]
MPAGSLLLAVTALASVQGPDLEERVNRAVDRAAEALLQQLRAGGVGNQPGAHYLAALALLKSGVPRSEPELAPILAYAREHNPPQASGTYTAGLQLMLFHEIGAAAEDQPARSVLAYLLRHQRANGLWAYPDGAPDLSNTQFALLGLRAARQIGLEVPEDCLCRCLGGLMAAENRQKGFPYQPGGGPSDSMTVSTLGGLAILDEFAELLPRLRTQLDGVRERRQAVEQAYAAQWEGQRSPPLSHGWGHYLLYALERYGDLAGIERFGRYDWYQEGAEFLLRQRDQDGAWGDVINTSFALLFLQRAYRQPGLAVTPQGDAPAAAAPKPPGPDPGVEHVASWLFAGPFPLDTALDLARLRPEEGARLNGQTWRRLQLDAGAPTPLLSLRDASAKPAWLLFATRLRYEALDPAWPPVELTAWLQLQEDWSLWLDGALVARRPRVRRGDTDAVVLSVAPGPHDLVILLRNDLSAARFGVRLSDSQGRPLPPLLRASANILRERGDPPSPASRRRAPG